MLVGDGGRTSKGGGGGEIIYTPDDFDDFDDEDPDDDLDIWELLDDVTESNVRIF